MSCLSPALKIGVTIAVLSEFGKHISSIDLLTICIIGMDKTSLHFFKENVSKPQISFALEFDTVDKIWSIKFVIYMIKIQEGGVIVYTL